MRAAVMSCTEPGSAAEIQIGNPPGRATVRTLPPWRCALPEYHRSMTSPFTLPACSRHRSTALICNALSFVVSLFCLLGIRRAAGTQEEPREQAELAERASSCDRRETSVGHDIRQGGRLVAPDPHLPAPAPSGAASPLAL